ncbi:unnamed protein product [Rhizoctonia solani]|uniref:Uncharacterized protein n=1 Tax=Rhizoctonia solani TaxID=456999 RepID=A0A8H2XKM5_9AGAM|nr:unnamed protein product [Rhizoctonia solani]
MHLLPLVAPIAIFAAIAWRWGNDVHMILAAIAQIHRQAICSILPTECKCNCAPVSFVEGLDVVYGENNKGRGLNGRDINAGFRGEYTYLVERRTDDPHRAVRGFSITYTRHTDHNAADLAKGARGLYRYLNAHYHDGRPIKSVFLSEARQGDGSTEDINKDRGGVYLYLCWNY